MTKNIVPTCKNLTVRAKMGWYKNRTIACRCPGLGLALKILSPKRAIET